jgi:hypothetical protein
MSQNNQNPQNLKARCGGTQLGCRPKACRLAAFVTSTYVLFVLQVL